MSISLTYEQTFAKRTQKHSDLANLAPPKSRIKLDDKHAYVRDKSSFAPHLHGAQNSYGLFLEITKMAAKSNDEKYQPSATAEAFLSKVKNGKYKRDIITGLGKFLDRKVPEDMQPLFDLAPP